MNEDRTKEKLRRRRRHSALGRVGYSIPEAARALGKRSDALRRLIERHAVAEGDEIVARLTGGIVARKRKNMGRWMVVIPAALRGETEGA
jgi:hypothetical protein